MDQSENNCVLSSILTMGVLKIRH